MTCKKIFFCNVYYLQNSNKIALKLGLHREHEVQGTDHIVDLRAKNEAIF